MDQTIKSICEVSEFLEKVQRLAANAECTQINNRPWANGKVNKTQAYMAETGITGADIRKTVSELRVKNYSSTKKDINPNFPDEYVWEFGIRKTMVDVEEDLYVKLKIRRIGDEVLLIMSFHPEQPRRKEDKLIFPYKDYEE